MKTMRVNFRAVRERFTHIDAAFESITVAPDLSKYSYTVRFYPWWEHPQYIEARSKGISWGFANASAEGAQSVVVNAEEPYVLHLTRHDNVIDWGFIEEHPLLWPYEDEAEITCNSDFDRMQLIEAVLRRRIFGLTEKELCTYISPLNRYKAPFSLGRFPTSLFWAVREELEQMGVRLFIGREPVARERPVLFLIDGEDYIIARDFNLDVPEFEHRPEWFRSSK